ncbi:hypothetical protein ASG29_01415 [Sphingomonas sp. Leaf412]|uniref:head GIN domain-containing protein n=1 Tax=Sphingomonas sp. Leaf412 TaxID=1736370 RepID=UPI0006F2601F|nr:head GIN domain-containing protein [Sphingomonas sp. Leaf412]KQT34843.1 hypothetical protein ASG29_01415 [Sphingomonas sp. Leaf412]
MRKFLIAALLPLAACGNDADDRAGIQGTGTGDARSYAVAGFSRVAAAGSDDVDVRVGPAFSVRAEGDSDVLDRLKIERDGDALKIGRRSGNFFSSGEAKVFVTMPALSGASLAGSGDMAIDRAQGDGLKASLAGSGNIRFAQVAVGKAEFSIAGSGDIEAAGTAKALEVSIAGSGDVKAKDLTASQADIRIAGSGSVRATVNGPAKVRAAGSGDVDLGAGARCDTKDLGSGEVTCGG